MMIHTSFHDIWLMSFRKLRFSKFVSALSLQTKKDVMLWFAVFLRMVHRLRYMVKPVVEEAQSALSRNLIAVTSSSTAPVKMAPTTPETKESDIAASGSPIVPLTEHGPSSDMKSLFLQVKDWASKQRMTRRKKQRYAFYMLLKSIHYDTPKPWLNLFYNVTILLSDRNTSSWN